MKIAISAQGTALTDPVDGRFGRARWLVIYDTDEQKIVETIDNSSNYNAPQGAGIKTAETVVNKGCEAVITGHLGPKAFNVLKSAGVKGFTGASGTIQSTIENFSEGKLKEALEADVKGHW